MELGENYIAKARIVIEHSVKREVKYDFAKVSRRYEDLYYRALEDNDYRLALSINKELIHLHGLHKVRVEQSEGWMDTDDLADKFDVTNCGK